MNKFISSKHLESVSDLTLIAPIKQGFVDAFESVTYETRLQLLLKALFKIRSSAREHSRIKPFVDTAERIQSLLDFRLAVLDTEPRQLMLSATFDRPFEPYMRLIWDPLGPLLDVIFCNCEGYVTATGHSFEEYLAWVRKSQVDSDYFYSMSGHSVSDIQYLLQIEKLQRERARLSGTAIIVPNPEKVAADVRKDEKTQRESQFLGVEALIGLYRLTDFYPPDDPQGDGELLRRAAQQLLSGWGWDVPKEWSSHLVPEQLAWFRAGLDKPLSDETAEEEALKWKEGRAREKAERLNFDGADIQGGIIENYSKSGEIRHGALLLMRVVDAEKARAFIGSLPVQDGRDPKARPKLGAFINLALAWRGLVKLGVPGEELERFPQEFREGMEDRAGLLGDLRANHPRRWRPPLRNWPPPSNGPGAERIDMSEVDFVIQLRTSRTCSDSAIVDVHQAGHPLRRMTCWLAEKAGRSGVQLLAVEPMRRATPDNVGGDTDHFGFRDGISQPSPVNYPPHRKLDEVSRGELLWGYPNDRSDPPPPPSEILDNGTFLVVRKLRQRVGRLREFVELQKLKHDIDPEILYGKMVGRKRSGELMLPGSRDPEHNKFGYDRDPKGEFCPFQSHIRRTNPRAEREGLTGRPTPRILRRGLSYGPLFPENGTVKDDEANRGVLFMAYNASIAEQFEVIQRWVNGGNSSGVGSWLSDPLMGVAEGEPMRKFRFRYFEPSGEAGADPEALLAAPGGEGVRARFRTKRVEMDQPFVELQWGAYFFVPSLAAIKAMARLSPVRAQEEAAARQRAEARRGERIIARLQALAAGGPEGVRAAAAGWKACLEDFRSKDPGERADGPAVWAAIRDYHGGAIRVPYGLVGAGETPPNVVLAASKDFVMRVFHNQEGHYSMCGQMARMKKSFGPIFLGLDGGEEYDRKAKINPLIYGIGEPPAFAVAYMTAAGYLEETLKTFAGMDLPPDPPSGMGVWGELDLRRDFVTPVLGAVCNQWFGIPDTLTGPDRKPGDVEAHARDKCPVNHVDLAGWGWEGARKPRCPGDFLSTSRYCFYPDPAPRVRAYGKAHGRALHKAVHAHFEEVKKPTAGIAQMMAAIPVYNDDRDEFARTLIGVMTGFLPPADATLRWTLYEWIEEKLFWRLQRDLVAAHPDETRILPAAAFGPALAAQPAHADRIRQAFVRATTALLEPLKQAMQKRPSPDMLWRTSVRGHKLGGVEVEDGDRVFIGIVSAMAEDANAGVSDVYPVFGGQRDPAKPGEPRNDDYPLHACPAYKFAMGTMLGILAALMDSVRIEPLPSPLLVRFVSRQNPQP